MAEQTKLDELCNLDVSSGNYVPTASGLIVKMKWSGKVPDPVEKEYQGRKQIKYPWNVKIFGFSWVNNGYAEVLQTENPEKLQKIKEFDKASENHILELSKSATKAFALFIKKESITNELIEYIRIGEGIKTIYTFKKAE